MPPPLPRQVNSPGKWRETFATVIRIVALIAVAGFFALVVLRVFGLLRPFTVPTSAMAPAIDPGDHIVMENIRYLLAKPKRGDVIVFKTDDIPLLAERATYVKRLVGLPGDRLSISGGGVYINGQRVSFRNEKGEIQFLHSQYARYLLDDKETLTVPSECYFVLGDNSAHSADSRFWGSVPAKSVLGRAAFCYWPSKQMRSIR